MKILDHLISTLDFDASTRDIRQGVFQTAVVTRHCGLASTLPRDALRLPPPMVEEPGVLLDRTPEELARMAYSERILEAAIGMAAVNSLLEVDEECCEELNAAELIIEKGEGKTVTVVGHFPFLERVRKRARALRVIEKNPTGDDLDDTHAEGVIPSSDVVAITGTALTNHTMEHLLGLCSPSAFVIVLGDTTPLSPVLFDYGVDAVCGTRVKDPDMVLRCVSQGATFRQIRGTRRLTMMK